MNTTKPVPPDLVSLTQQFHEFLGDPGHTRLHQTLRANSAANIARAIDALKTTERIKQIENEVATVKGTLASMEKRLQDVERECAVKAGQQATQSTTRSTGQKGPHTP